MEIFTKVCAVNLESYRRISASFFFHNTCVDLKRCLPAYIQPKFVGAKVIKKYYDINEKTLSWASRGKLRHVRYEGEEDKRLYDFEHLRETRTKKQKKRECIAYAVSSVHHQQDLEMQTYIWLFSTLSNTFCRQVPTTMSE